MEGYIHRESCLSVVAQLREELEASRTKVACVQSMLQGDDVRSSAVAEYLQSATYCRRVEFEWAHHSQSGLEEGPHNDGGSPMLADSRCWVRGRLWSLDPLVLSTGVAYVGGFSMLDQGLPIAAGPTRS
ncbi:hypothetical protein ACLOJK_014607 [Asimina triloba]